MSRSLARVFVLTRNEYDLIEDFLIHHGSIFGYENLVVVDNGSDHPEVLATYGRYQAMGVTIIVDRRPISRHGEILSECMREYRGQSEFLIPLDTDEFICPIPVGDDLSADRILEVLRQIPKTVSVIRFGAIKTSVPRRALSGFGGYREPRPARGILSFRDQDMDKVFVRSEPFLKVAKGNHSAEVDSGSAMVSGHLCLLHYHFTGPARLHERCAQAAERHGFTVAEKDVFDRMQDCRYFLHRPGGHHCLEYLRFLAREGLLHLWASMPLSLGLPGPEDVRVAHSLCENPRIRGLLRLYILWRRIPRLARRLVRKEPTALAPEDVVFGFWPSEQATETISWVARFLETTSVTATGKNREQIVSPPTVSN